jgi:O-antigen/teichoic acid export membrane protein
MLGRAAVMAISFISFPIYARLLPVADYGILNLAQKCVNFVVAVSKLGLQNAILRLHVEYSSSHSGLRKLYSTASLSSLAGGVVCTVLSAALVWIAQLHWISKEVGMALLISCGLVITRTGLSPIYGLLRVEGQTFLFNLLDVVTRIAALIAGVALLLFWVRSANSLLLGLILGDLAALAIGAKFVAGRKLVSFPAFDPALLKHSLSFALPLAGSELATTLLASADRTLVQYYLGSQPLGYYAAACSMANYLQEALQVPLNLALVPLYVKTWKNEGPEETGRLVSRTFDLFLMACGLIIGVTFASAQQLIVFVSSSKYEAVYPLLGPLVVGFLLFASSMFLSAGFLLEKKTMVLARLVAIAFVIKTLFNILLLKPWGLWGAVVPCIIGYALMAGMSAWYSRDMLRIRVPLPRLLLYAAAATSAALLGGLFKSPTLLIALLVRASTATAAYGAILWCFDGRVRRASVQLLEMAKQRLHTA